MTLSRTAVTLALILALCAAIPATAQDTTEEATPELAPNEWVRVSKSQLGATGYRSMRGPALLYVPELDRFLAALGVQNRFDRKTPCYSETLLSLDEGVWVNWYPKGKDWGPRVGPAEKVPGMGGYGTGLKKGEGGVLRPHLRGGYGVPVWHQYCWDSDRNKAIFLFRDNLIQYDPVERVWTDLEEKGNPTIARLPGVEVQKGSKLHWSALCYDPINKEVVLFGGASTITERGDPGTRVYSIAEKTWRQVATGSEGMHKLHGQARALREKAQVLLTGVRNRYYHTERQEIAKKSLPEVLAAALDNATIEKLLGGVNKQLEAAEGYEKTQLQRAKADLADVLALHADILKQAAGGADVKLIQSARTLKDRFRQAAISLDSQPPQRCYSPMVYDPNSKKIVLFGGNHLDRCLADTWVYDPAIRTWEDRRPPISPSPRHCHGLLYLPKAGKVALVGGWLTKLQRHNALPPELWTYDVAANRWQLVKRWKPSKNDPFHGIIFRAPHSNVVPFAVSKDDVALTQHTSGTWACRLDVSTVDEQGTEKHGVKPGTERMVAEDNEEFSPHWYDSAPRPKTETIDKLIATLEPHTWTTAPQGERSRPGFAYSTIAYNPDHDEILIWAGGHATTHQTVISRYSLATGTWHIDYPTQLPMSYGRKLWGKNYAYGYRPFMPRHPWDGYAYDPTVDRLFIMRTTGPLMLQFDSDKGDFDRPDVQIPPRGSASTETMCSSADGALIWTNRLLYRFDKEKNQWESLPVKGPMPKSAYYAGIARDDKRGHYVLFTADRRKKGGVYRYDPSDGTVKSMKPANSENAPGLPREIKYIPEADIFFNGTGEYWDPIKNVWGKLDVNSKAIGSIGPNEGVIWDVRRKVLWMIEGKRPRRVSIMKPDFSAIER
ncbi:MAG: kelch repeat-containing protein [bacterium]